MSLRREDERLLQRVLDGEASPAETELLVTRARDDEELRLAIEQTRAVEERGRALPELAPSRDLVALAEREFVAGPQTASGEPSRNPRRWPGAAAVLGLVAAACVTWLLARPEVPQRVDAPEPPRRWTVAALQGPAWIQQQGARREAAVGDLLGEGDRIETGMRGTATLSGGVDGISLTLDERSHLGAVRWARPTVEIMIDHGAVRADVPSSAARALHVRVRGSLDHVEVKDGLIAVLTDGNGAATVACERGTATLRTGTRGQPISTGTEIASRDGRWTEAHPTPTFLLLEASARRDLGGATSYVIEGRTNPGAQLLINGELVPVAADGAFVYRWEAPDGAPVRVSARDALFRAKEVTIALEKPRRAPPAPKPGPPPDKDSDWDVGWDAPKTPG